MNSENRVMEVIFEYRREIVGRHERVMGVIDESRVEIVESELRVLEVRLP